MKRSLPNIFSKKRLLLPFVSLLSLGSFAQTVTIIPSGTVAQPNLIPVDNSVSFSINPIGFGACLNSLSYSWAVVNAINDTIFRSSLSTPSYEFTVKGIYTIALTVKTVPGGYCTANVTKTAKSTVKVADDHGSQGVPKPNMFSANALGTYISAYAMDNNGKIVSGPYDYFDPFPADNAITAALSMDDKGNYFYLPTFLNGSDPLTASQVPMAGVVEVWAVDKKAKKPPVVIASFDMNGASTSELGLYRMGLDQKGNAWILAGDGTNMYAATFKTDGTKVVNTTNITAFPVPFESGSASDFQSGDLAFDNNDNMYVLAGSSTGVNIYTMSTKSATPKLSKKWKVTNAAGSPFGLAVTGTVFDASGNMYFSALDGIYFINQNAVNPATGTAVVQKISENFGLMDLATSQFPTAWTPPFDPVVLPIQLLQFTGTASAEKVNLGWSVASNENGLQFELEKSDDGADFKTQAVIFNTERQGKETYSFTDAAPTTDRIYYRLKIVGKNEAVSYSNIVHFRAQTKETSTLALLQNPVQGALNFNYAASSNQTAEISIYSFSGVKLLSQKRNLQKGNHSLSLPLDGRLPKGIYLVEVREGNNRQTARFVKQ